MNKVAKLGSFTAVLILCTSASFVEDLGFRYKDGKCVNEKGIEGLNPGFFGQCADLKGVVLGFNLDGIDFSGSEFTGADLRKSTLNKAILVGVNFDNANLAGVEFNAAQIQKSSFKKSVLRNVVLANASIEEIDFTEADFSNSTLSYMKVSNSNFRKSKFKNASLDLSESQNANFEGADFSESNLTEADFTGANLSQVIMNEANLTKANLSQVKADGGKFKKVNFTGSNLKGVSLAKSDLRRARFTAVQVENTNFEGSDVRATDFSDIDIKKINLTKAAFNKKTLLPIKKEEAEQLGMIFKTGGSVLILWEQKTTNLDLFKKAIELGGNEAVFSDKVAQQYDGTNIFDFDAVVFFNTYYYYDEMNANGQKALVQFVKDGGLFIHTEFSAYSIDQVGINKGLVDLIISTFEDGVGGTMSIVPVDGKANHPIFEGISKTDKMESGYTVSGMRQFETQPSELLAELPDGTDIIATRQFENGRIVGFFFSCDDLCIGNKLFQKLTVNALNAFL